VGRDGAVVRGRYKTRIWEKKKGAWRGCGRDEWGGSLLLALKGKASTRNKKGKRKRNEESGRPTGHRGPIDTGKKQSDVRELIEKIDRGRTGEGESEQVLRNFDALSQY